jgi:hypothetical protein
MSRYDNPDQHDEADNEAPHRQPCPRIYPKHGGLTKKGSTPPANHGRQSEDKMGNAHGIPPFSGNAFPPFYPTRESARRKEKGVMLLYLTLSIFSPNTDERGICGEVLQ